MKSHGTVHSTSVFVMLLKLGMEKKKTGRKQTKKNCHLNGLSVCHLLGLGFGILILESASIQVSMNKGILYVSFSFSSHNGKRISTYLLQLWSPYSLITFPGNCASALPIIYRFSFFYSYMCVFLFFRSG